MRIAYSLHQVCEKEAKTKTFSKEGLAREQKLDPKEAAKNKSREWLRTCVDNLNTQIESFDADLERLMAGKGRSNGVGLDTMERRRVIHLISCYMSVYRQE